MPVKNINYLVLGLVGLVGAGLAIRGRAGDQPVSTQVGRYQLTSGEYKVVKVDQDVKMSEETIQGLFRIDTTTGEVEMYVPSRTKGQWRHLP